MADNLPEEKIGNSMAREIRVSVGGMNILLSGIRCIASTSPTDWHILYRFTEARGVTLISISVSTASPSRSAGA